MSVRMKSKLTQMDVRILSYLEACNKIFENGFLSHKRIFDMDSEVLKSINDGHKFFTSWLDKILEAGKFFSYVITFICAL